MEITVPPGYKKLIPLDKDKHRGLGLPAEPNFLFASGMNAIGLYFAEFISCAHNLPIVFVQDESGSGFTSVAVTGFLPGENLCVNQQGLWAAGTYVPAYIRRYPFCLATPAGMEPSPQNQLLVCFDEDSLVEDGQPLFDDNGAETELWSKRQKLLIDTERARDQTNDLINVLTEHDLLMQFNAEISPNGKEPLRLNGMYRVDEAKLKALPAETLKTLTNNGQLSRIYAHMMSLDHFSRLLDLWALKQQQAETRH